MPVKYFVSRPDGTRTSMIPFAKAKSTVRDQAKKYAADKKRKMRLKEVGDPKFGIWRGELDKTMEQWERLVLKTDPGSGVVLDIADYPYSVATRVIMDEPPKLQTQGNSDIDKIYTYLTRNFKGRNGGICNKRNIAGSSSWSQHAPWPPPDPGSNAVDWFSSPDNMDELYDQGRKLAAAASKEPSSVPVGLILCGSQSWEPGRGWAPSSAAYHRHLHIQGRRTRTGYPSGSC
jgi:hypothetical protein